MTTPRRTAMNTDLDPMRGIVNGILLSLPFWAVAALLLKLFGVLG